MSKAVDFCVFDLMDVIKVVAEYRGQLQSKNNSVFKAQYLHATMEITDFHFIY